jgi:hypothetical protein
MASQEIREDGKQVQKAANLRRVMTMQHACLARSQIPTADPQKPARLIGEAIPAEVTVLENHDEVRIPEAEAVAVAVVVVVEEAPCPGFETA